MKIRDIIHPWAVGDQLSLASPHSRRDQTSGEYELITANISDIFSLLDDNQAINANSRQGKARISGAEEHWASGGAMDPSIVYIGSATLKRPKGSLWFTDGRHRLWARRNDEWAPVLVPKSSVQKFKSLIRTR